MCAWQTFWRAEKTRVLVASAFVAERRRELHTRVDITRLPWTLRPRVLRGWTASGEVLTLNVLNGKSCSSSSQRFLGFKPQRLTALRKQRFASCFENLRAFRSPFRTTWWVWIDANRDRRCPKRNRGFWELPLVACVVEMQRPTRLESIWCRVYTQTGACGDWGETRRATANRRLATYSLIKAQHKAPQINAQASFKKKPEFVDAAATNGLLFPATSIPPPRCPFNCGFPGDRRKVLLHGYS